MDCSHNTGRPILFYRVPLSPAAVTEKSSANAGFLSGKAAVPEQNYKTRTPCISQPTRRRIPQYFKR